MSNIRVCSDHTLEFDMFSICEEFVLLSLTSVDLILGLI